MNIFLWNLLLAVTWAVATGHFTLGNLLLGMVLGYFILWFARRTLGPTNYFAKVPQVVTFAIFYIKQLILSNLRVAYDVITPTHYMQPGVIDVPLDARTDAEITLLANLITLTPGTLSLDVADDRRTLYVHCMYIPGNDIAAARDEIKQGLERRVLEVMR
jgi:multicomponent Na+:H+ antiporter subunit E